jgi:hypothetical protein
MLDISFLVLFIEELAMLKFTSPYAKLSMGLRQMGNEGFGT